jgi:hypothetical protein
MKKSPEKLLKHLQDLLNEIATLGPEESERFKICKARAARLVRKLKRDYQDLKIVPPKPEGSDCVAQYSSGSGGVIS